MSNLNTGLDATARQAVADAINGVLAETYVLYMKTHSYHWNVTGPQFNTLHQMFEEQYNEMWAALDVLAERVRALGQFAPASGKAFQELAQIESAEATPPKAADMIINLLEGHELIIRRIRQAMSVADEANDAATEDLLTQRIHIHEKTAWMLRSLTE